MTFNSTALLGAVAGLGATLACVFMLAGSGQWERYSVELSLVGIGMVLFLLSDQFAGGVGLSRRQTVYACGWGFRLSAMGLLLYNANEILQIYHV